MRPAALNSDIQVWSSDSPSSWLPVTDCQKPGKSARSSNSTRSSGVCTSTSVDTGILRLKGGKCSRHPREGGDPFCDRQKPMDSRLRGNDDIVTFPGNDDIVTFAGMTIS